MRRTTNFTRKEAWYYAVGGRKQTLTSSALQTPAGILLYLISIDSSQLVHFIFRLTFQMPGQVRWATDNQTKFLDSRFSKYAGHYTGDKKYGPFWAKIKEEWFNAYPMSAASMFPEKLKDELTEEDEAAVGNAIKKVMQVWSRS